ncbi:MAG: restriction endonuclease subunit S [Lachnoanaerobaculum saburreum]
MVNWKEKTLGEVTSFITKGIPPKYSDYESESTIWVLNQKCNRNFEISYADARLHDYNLKKVPENKMLMNGDVLINSTGTGTAGRVAQLQNIKKPTTIDGHMILLRPTDDIDSLYYGYAIKSCQSQIEGLAEGSTGQTELNRKRLQDEVIIRYPVDKQEQKAIAYLLSDLDEKIKINVKINNNLQSNKPRFIGLLTA